MNAATVFRKPLRTEPALSLREAEPPLSPQQSPIAAAETEAAVVKAKWKTLINEAHAVWRKLPVEELAKVQGNFRGLTELVSARYQLSHDIAERQVRKFFDHYLFPNELGPTPSHSRQGSGRIGR